MNCTDTFKIGDIVGINNIMHSAVIVGFTTLAGSDMVLLRRMHPVTGNLENGTPLSLPLDGIYKLEGGVS